MHCLLAAIVGELKGGQAEGEGPGGASLEVVTVANTRATPMGIERLQKALPKAKVFVDRTPR